MQAQRQVSPTPVRMPDELRMWLKHKAIDNYRSMNSEVVARLEESRRREEAQHEHAGA